MNRYADNRTFFDPHMMNGKRRGRLSSAVPTSPAAAAGIGIMPIMVGIINQPSRFTTWAGKDTVHK